MYSKNIRSSALQARSNLRTMRMCARLGAQVGNRWPHTSCLYYCFYKCVRNANLNACLASDVNIIYIMQLIKLTENFDYLVTQKIYLSMPIDAATISWYVKNNREQIVRSLSFCACPFRRMKIANFWRMQKTYKTEISRKATQILMPCPRARFTEPFIILYVTFIIIHVG